jgi:hypothetical protein
VLSTHFNKKSSGENFFIIMISNEVNGINFHLKYNLEWSRIVVFNFDKFKIWEGFFDIFLGCIEIAFNQIQCDVLNFLI